MPEPTEDTNIPDITLTALNEDGTAADGQGTDDWYRTKNITLTAPEGYNIVENLYDRSGKMSTLDIELEEGENHIVTHDRLVAESCDRIIKIVDGRVQDIA